MIYFGSDDYSGGQDGLRTELKGSAICTETAWVLCEDCEDHVFPDSRIRHGFNEALGQSATFYLQNKCNGTTVEQSMINLGVLVLMCVGILIMNVRIKRVETEFDEDEQTAQDYSIVISNPPIDAYNPEEWRIFFRDNFQAYVTTCTVGVDNDLLVNSLVERREKLKKIEMSVKPGTSLDTLTLAQIAAKHEEKRRFFGRLMAIFSPGIPELVHRVVVLNCKVQGLAQESKPVSNVFVTFETEADQRKVLNLMLNGGAVHAKDLLFRGTHVLKVKEPDEPNTIRWQDLNETNMQKLKQQFFTSFATFVSIVVMAVIVRVCNDWSVVYSAFAISIANVMFPSFAKALTNLEAHHSEGTKQRSLYFKIALFRLVNTAVVITIIRSFSETLVDEEGLIQQVYSLFFTEIVTTTALQLADIGGHVSRHFLAPRAKTQDAMNLAMQGTSVELAERFTNMTKILFLALWYCSIFPAALFLCSFALFINYFIDRFSLMRSWKRMPQLGTEISKLSRYYFFPTALTAMAILSSYYWSGFPFDNLCQKDGEFVKESFVGEWVIDPKEDAKEGEIDDTVIVSVNATTPNTVHCRQDLLRYYPEDWKVRIRFPFSPNFQSEGLEWMTDDQETATGIWSWVAVAFAALLAVLFTGFFLKSCCFQKKYRPRGNDMKINFSEVETISAYIPQVNSSVFAYPLVACNADNIDDSLFDWDDPERSFHYYDITKDADYLLQGLAESSGAITFSQVAIWLPMKKEHVAL